MKRRLTTDVYKKNIPRNEWINQECIKLGREVHRLKKKFNQEEKFEDTFHA